MMEDVHARAPARNNNSIRADLVGINQATCCTMNEAQIQRAVLAHLRIRGVPARLRGGNVDAAGDHRVAMLGAIAGVCSQQGVDVHGSDALGVSFPDFPERLAGVTG